MKFQSALEFITTYSFMFIIIGVAVLLVFLLANSASTYVPSNCVGVSGLTCKSDTFITSSSGPLNSNMILVLSNSQSVPVNVISVLIKLSTNQTSVWAATGNCAPTYLAAGNTMVCSLTFPGVGKPTGQSVRGSYIITAQACNGGVAQLTQATCFPNNYTTETYGGSFSTQVIPGGKVSP